ncbi:hypothetical protein CFAM422_000099 [Trichoderma lentiforme]|uniref:Uncharacterized protein n=1 Tax=Trichoderma lentiforme TaxID=1567552 RepID=A0A9P5CJF6_9HYPO|nr:hypothetical protein CFAM422_000099 [Trichoderma lentiforme]
MPSIAAAIEKREFRRCQRLAPTTSLHGPNRSTVSGKFRKQAAIFKSMGRYSIVRQNEGWIRDRL